MTAFTAFPEALIEAVAMPDIADLVQRAKDRLQTMGAREDTVVHQLDVMERCIVHWLEGLDAEREREGLRTDADTTIYTAPNFSHGQMAAWIVTLKEARALLSE